MKAAWKGRHVRLCILRSGPPDPAPSRYVMACTFNFTNNFGHGIEIRIVSSREQLRLTEESLSFQVSGSSIKMQKLSDFKVNIFFLFLNFNDYIGLLIVVTVDDKFL
jgi:hypothetical protein